MLPLPPPVLGQVGFELLLDLLAVVVELHFKGLYLVHLLLRFRLMVLPEAFLVTLRCIGRLHCQRRRVRPEDHFALLLLLVLFLIAVLAVLALLSLVPLLLRVLLLLLVLGDFLETLLVLEELEQVLQVPVAQVLDVLEAFKIFREIEHQFVAAFFHQRVLRERTLQVAYARVVTYPK